MNSDESKNEANREWLDPLDAMIAAPDNRRVLLGEFSARRAARGV